MKFENRELNKKYSKLQNSTEITQNEPKQIKPDRIFNDPEKGFLVDGEFGAHVKIASSPPVVSVDANLPLHKFSWSIRDFSALKQNDCLSKEKNWTLTLYPKGDSIAADDKLFTVLHLAEGETLMNGELIMVRVHVQVLDPRGSNHITCWLKSWVMASTKERGILQSSGKIEETHLDVEDTVNVEIECEIVNVVKNHPFF